MLTPWLVYNLILLVVLLSLLGIVALNLLVLPRIERYALLDPQTPSVAILVPARNEAANLEACLRSLLAQDYPAYEVWLYDDASTDTTLEIAQRIASEAKGRLHVVRGQGDPPAGWLGKANACHRLFLAMREQYAPEYVLFTDADVRFEPGAVGHAIACAEAKGAGLLSIFPRQVTVTWAERLAVPILLHWTVYTFLPLLLAHSKRTGPAFAAANGQFMLFRREAYEAFGGHTAVRSQVLEDVALARATKRAGHAAILADGGPLLHTRMYRDAAEVWAGYSKNAYAFFGYSPLYLLTGIVALVTLYISPVVTIFYSALSAQPYVLLLALAQYAVAVAARLLLAVRFRYRLVDAFLHPAAVAYVIAIAVNSMRWAMSGRSEWKGRAVSRGGKGELGSD